MTRAPQNADHRASRACVASAPMVLLALVPLVARGRPLAPALAVEISQAANAEPAAWGPGGVQTELGLVRGSAAGATYAFKSIPYAAPPVGEFRWRPPAPAACWPGERDATAYGASCAQRTPTGGVGGENDWLTLNVWAPATAAPGSQPRPVLVFLHGGGNNTGASSQPIYDGQALAERGSVVVTANYRLGALGFLAHLLGHGSTASGALTPGGSLQAPSRLGR